MEQLNDEELQEVEGGAAGYGNVQYTCACGKVVGTEINLVKHMQSTKHRTATVYYQKEKGKLSQGKKIGMLTAKIDKKCITLKYPNKKSVKYGVDILGKVFKMTANNSSGGVIEFWED